MGRMEIKEILERLPHRYPFLLIDRILECNPGESLIAVKNVSYNEQFFQGHFPSKPIMPGVLILEAMAQATCILVQHSLESSDPDKYVYYFVGIDKARFRQPVEPGDQLIVEVKPVRHTRGIWKVNAEARVDDKIVASAELMGALREIDA